MAARLAAYNLELLDRSVLKPSTYWWLLRKIDKL